MDLKPVLLFLVLLCAGTAYVEAGRPTAVVPAPVVKDVTPEPQPEPQPDTGKPAGTATSEAPQSPGERGIDDAPLQDATHPAISEATAQPEWQKCIYHVRQRSHGVVGSGTAVSLGNGLLVTAWHVVESRGTPEVLIGDKWVPANYRREKNDDVAYLTIRDTSLPSVTTRQPEYGESVHVFGLRTKHPMAGRICDTDMAALEPNEEGVDQGDSGGGVFGLDGKLLGTIRSHRDVNRRVVFFTPLNPPKPYAATNQAGPSSKLYLLTAPSWCAPCRQVDSSLLPVLRNQGMTVGEDAGSDVQVLNYDDPESVKLVKSMGYVQATYYLPAFLKVEGGKVVDSKTGSLTLEQFKTFAGVK